MGPQPFDASIVLAHTDIRGALATLSLEVVMDAVEHAVADIPGIGGIEICYLGARMLPGNRVRVRSCGGNKDVRETGPWNAFLCREVERCADLAIAGLVRRAA